MHIPIRPALASALALTGLRLTAVIAVGTVLNSPLCAQTPNLESNIARLLRYHPEGADFVSEIPKFYEGAWIHKRNGIYYASYPTRPKGAQANVMVYSMAKSPLGPWEYKGTILDNHSGNVHGSITEFKGQTYLFYHVAASPNKRERRVCVELLHYNEDGTIKPIQMTPPQSDFKSVKTGRKSLRPI